MECVITGHDEGLAQSLANNYFLWHFPLYSCLYYDQALNFEMWQYDDYGNS
jgi:hypothetical protein